MQPGHVRVWVRGEVKDEVDFWGQGVGNRAVVKEDGLDGFGRADCLEPFKNLGFCPDKDKSGGVAQREGDLVAKHWRGDDPLVARDVVYIMQKGGASKQG